MKKLVQTEMEEGTKCMCNQVGMCPNKLCWHRKKHEADESCKLSQCDYIQRPAYCREL